MSRARELSRLGNPNVITADSSNNVGLGTTASIQYKLDVIGDANFSGVVTASAFGGDGSALTGVAATDNINTNNIKISGITTFGSGASTFPAAVSITASTNSTSTTTGALVVTGGVGIAGSLHVGENVSVGGTLTYEDVTNIDSVGVVTAQLGVNVSGGDLKVGSAFTVAQSGVVTATSYYGDGSALTGVAATDYIVSNSLKVIGVSTFAGGDIQIDGSAAGVSSVTWDASANSLIFKDKSYAKFGDGSDLVIHHDAANSYITNATGNLNIQAKITEDSIIAKADDAVELYFNGGKKLETTLTGSKTTGVSSCTSHCIPTADAGANLGSTTNRWANIYTADMQLSNEGFQNDIDGTWGKYTIQEGEDDLFLINRRTGKKYKFMLEEVQ